MTKTQKKKVLEISLSRIWQHQRREMRRIFSACEENGYSVSGYPGVLEDALKVAKRAVAAIDILEAAHE